MLRAGGTRLFEIRFPGKQTLRQVLGCQRLPGSVLESASAEGEGKDWRGQMGELSREAGSVETTARHTAGLKRGMQSCRLPGRGPGSRCLYHCWPRTRAAALGLGPFSAFASRTPKAAGGTWVSTSGFPTNGRTEFFVAEGISGQGLAASTTKGSQSKMSTRGGSWTNSSDVV